ncbi:MAG: copper homeostasis protein CutC [Pseudomonadota bacterium]
MTKATPTLEICVDSHAGLAAAIEGGADRIELCAALDLGGLSPSLSLLKAAQDCPVPVYCMVRPRPGDFVFSLAEIAGMCAEIAQIRDLGLAGVVLGAGSPDGLDVAALKTQAAAAEGLGRTLHRVVDISDDPIHAVDIASDLGFERVLTSGGAPKAIEAVDKIASMVSAAPEGLSVMPGGGVTPDNAANILHRTGAHEIHGSARRITAAGSSKLRELEFIGDQQRETDAATVRALKEAIRQST